MKGKSCRTSFIMRDIKSTHLSHWNGEPCLLKTGTITAMDRYKLQHFLSCAGFVVDKWVGSCYVEALPYCMHRRNNYAHQQLFRPVYGLQVWFMLCLCGNVHLPVSIWPNCWILTFTFNVVNICFFQVLEESLYHFQCGLFFFFFG